MALFVIILKKIEESTAVVNVKVLVLQVKILTLS